MDTETSTTDRVIPFGATIAVGRFQVGGPLGYIAANTPGAVVRGTRGEARADYIAGLDR